MTQDIWRPDLQLLLDGLGGTEPEFGPGTLDYVLDDLTHEVDVIYGGQRVRIVVYIDELEVAAVSDATSWISDETDRSPALLDVWTDEPTEVTYLTATFERPLHGHDWPTDPLERHAAEIWHAWGDQRPIEIDGQDVVQFGDPIALEPQSAWLLMGSEASFATEEEVIAMQRAQRIGVYDYLWTSAKQTKAGDLLLVYFTSPHKQVRFVARAASDAFFTDEIGVKSDGNVADQQWWVPTTPLIEIEPIPFKRVQAASDGHLILKGRSGHYLPSDVIDALPFRAPSSADQSFVSYVVRRPTGLATLPDPITTTFDEWRLIAPGALRIEKDVSTHLVEPLLRMMGLDQWQREFRVGRGSADYVVFDESGPASVIEVKLATRPSKDLVQLQKYTTPLSCNGILFDALRLRLVSADEALPIITIDRSSISASDLATIATHLRRHPSAHSL